MSKLTQATITKAMKGITRGAKPTIKLSDGGGRGEGRLILQIWRPKDGSDYIRAEWYARWSTRSGRRMMAKVGAYSTDPSTGLGLAAARKEFREKFLPAIQSGENPKARKARDEARGVTVVDLFKSYVSYLGDRSSASMVKRALLGMKGDGEDKRSAAWIIGPDMPAADVTPEHIVRVLSEYARRGAFAGGNHVRAYMSAAFQNAMQSKNQWYSAVSGTDFGHRVNPVKMVPRCVAAVKVGTRYLEAAEFRKFWVWLQSQDFQSLASRALRLSMALGQRQTEILRITSDMYNATEQSLYWDRTKTGWRAGDDSPHMLPVNHHAAAVLEGMNPDHKGRYFPSKSKIKEYVHFTALGKLVDRYVAATGTAKFSPRDLRRTWATLASKAGLSDEMIDRLQNHAIQGVGEKNYRKYDKWSEKKAAMAVWSAYLDRILAGDLDNEVVNLGPEAVKRKAGAAE